MSNLAFEIGFDHYLFKVPLDITRLMRTAPSLIPFYSTACSLEDKSAYIKKGMMNDFHHALFNLNHGVDSRN